MRKLAVLMMVMVLAVVFAMPTMAQEKKAEKAPMAPAAPAPEKKAPAPAPVAPAPEKKAPAPAPAAATVEGTVTKVDASAMEAAAKTVTVKTADGKQESFKAGDAKIMKGGKDATLADLKDGDKVTVTCEKDVAKKIEVK